MDLLANIDRFIRIVLKAITEILSCIIVKREIPLLNCSFLLRSKLRSIMLNRNNIFPTNLYTIYSIKRSTYRWIIKIRCRESQSSTINTTKLKCLNSTVLTKIALGFLIRIQFFVCI